MNSQEKFHEDFHDLCSRTQVNNPIQPLPSANVEDDHLRSSCAITSMADIAQLDTSQLWDYLTIGDSPISCINRTIYSFNATHSPIFFDEDKVLYIARRTAALALNYNGSDDRIIGPFVYLSNAGHQSNFYSDQVSFAKATWDEIQLACTNLAENAHIFQLTDQNFYGLAHMFFTASFDSIGAHPSIIETAKTALDGFASDSYEALSNLYPYYYSYYYLLDVYFRYNSVNPTFINALTQKDTTILSLGDVATNLNINGDTYSHFEELSNHAVTAITRYAPYPELHHVVEPSLIDVTEVYPDYGARWVRAALSLVRNGLNFPISEDEILGNLEQELFPNDFYFDDGRIQIATPLTYDEITILHQSIQEVRAQFFRLIRDDVNLPDDDNDTLFIKLHGSRSSYQNFNDILFGINYPNSGGVYIELYGTFYTYQREEGESTYTMEELFRHEYAHYLQGRYLVDGLWGDAPIYQNDRMVWFEEGMAQFLAASTRTDGIKGLQPIREAIQSDGMIDDLNTIFSSSYSSGNQDAYYVYAPLLWSHWLADQNNIMYDMVDAIRTVDIAQFDLLVDNLRTDVTANDSYTQFVQNMLDNDDFWIHPQTSAIHFTDLDYANEDDIFSAFANASIDLDVGSYSLTAEMEPRQFEYSAQGAISNSESNIGSILHELHQLSNQWLEELQLDSLNLFEYTLAYFTSVVIDDSTHFEWHLVGPINDTCRSRDIQELQVEAHEDFAVLMEPDLLNGVHQFRYREQGNLEWVDFPFGNTGQDTIYNLMDSVVYEFQMRLQCDEDVWSLFSQSKTFVACPDVRNMNKHPIDDSLILAASDQIASASEILPNAIVSLMAGNHIELMTEFVVSGGAAFEALMQDCRFEQ